MCPTNTTNDNVGFFFWQPQTVFLLFQMYSFQEITVAHGKAHVSDWTCCFVFGNLVYYCFTNMLMAVVHMIGIVLGKYSQKYH